MPYSENPMTVGRLIELLKLCPPEANIQMYYDGGPRPTPNMAFSGKDYDGNNIVVLAKYWDVYNLKPDATVYFTY